MQNRGVAVGDGKVFFGTKDNYMVALDQKTGHEVWKVKIDDRASSAAATSLAAPLVVKDKVIVGGTGGDQAHRGYLTAFNTQDRPPRLALVRGARARRKRQRDMEGR